MPHAERRIMSKAIWKNLPLLLLLGCVHLQNALKSTFDQCKSSFNKLRRSRRRRRDGQQLGRQSIANFIHLIKSFVSAIFVTLTQYYCLVVVARYVQLVLRRRSRGKRPFSEANLWDRMARIDGSNLFRAGPWAGALARGVSYNTNTGSP